MSFVPGSHSGYHIAFGQHVPLVLPSLWQLVLFWFWWPWNFPWLGILYNFPHCGCVQCFSHCWTEPMGLGEEYHRSQVPFSSHYSKSTYYQHCITEGVYLDVKLKIVSAREFPSGPAVRTGHFHYWGPGSIPGWVTKILQASRAWTKDSICQIFPL